MDENVFDEIKKLAKRKLAIDMPDLFIATVISIGDHRDKYGRSLKLGLRTNIDILSDMMYRIPKSFAGKGQLEKFRNCLKKLNISFEEKEILGKMFEWQRMELSGPFKGNPRHYPIRLMKE